MGSDKTTLHLISYHTIYAEARYYKSSLEYYPKASPGSSPKVLDARTDSVACFSLSNPYKKGSALA